MGDKVNKYGLSRYIPSHVRRQIRQQSGFGCVNCGLAIHTYEHIDPLFKDAREHDPEKMTLLCGSCQNKSTSGTLSKDTIKYRAANPITIQKGFSRDDLDLGRTHPKVTVGTIDISETENIIRVFGEPILCVDPPEIEGGPFRLSALMTDKNSNEILVIDANEWRSPISNWDVEQTGKRLIIRQKLREISLVLRAEPPGRIVFEKIDACYEGVKITCREGKPLKVEMPDGIHFESESGRLVNCDSAIDIDNRGIHVGRNCQDGYANFNLNSM